MNNSPDKNNKDADGKMLVRQESFQSFSGPLPPPEILERFNSIVPGAAERIIKMAEDQFAHRVDLEKRVIKSDVERSKWGQILGFIISIFGLTVALFVSIKGQQWASSIIGGGTLASLVGVFMYGTKSRRKERESKSRSK
ncbi:MAG: hypothetical protein A3A96_00250 [Candidatus Zambryskibacteria bacterium RIFCSPLOWO2_01_FULL_39_39]|uniref:DUF2335 domain-containing protein n=1 Tax=Candidatus Zambryskibacteria bacterium RIFCSPLOWO2_01_FULL_39_39 TaxID=1802758 RepID=A0A1G2TXH4_9BACT|nr:MAG: hypothetical protein UT00_C0001G0051 [Parcubacteria group bacterium GW2011_GWA1_38_7]OHA87859.1 MAG: hypothetical protein A2644_01645 [Candidatus Zambryskibacteria bacterium RIFCSPHIGHO2_01_FULL_39_63]OHA94917.1 MAG: hypothetical protein A3B88_00870 [Candidatus Zambryskibacteria bacterium RIFCSPHIGHO2_02_FULL_39_19]OHA99097.1 MAG: hypothetical protein A3F20_02820 [Candidatus Zambryskibacteria bacterium RIFCSPHIGHO2_12_FULL_39_21]OHB01859.1 MAG: hypothetical protein A3A96_00250 [Candidat